MSAPREFAPIADIETYIFMASLKGEEADAMRALYLPPPPAQKIARRDWDVPHDPDYVRVHMKIKGGRVKVSLTCPLEPLQPYYKAGHKPPLELRVIAAKKFGYPDHVLEGMIARDDWFKRNSQKLDAFIESVFGPTRK
jgi:hypothetical protein